MPYLQKSPGIWCWECHLCRWQTNGTECQLSMIPDWIRNEKRDHLNLHRLASSSEESAQTEPRSQE